MFLIINLFLIITVISHSINANFSNHFNISFKPSLDIKLKNISREISLYGILFNQHINKLEHTYLIGNISIETFSIAIKQHEANVTFVTKNQNNYQNKCVNKENVLTLQTYKCFPQFHGILVYLEDFPIDIKYIFDEISITYQRNNNSFGYENYKKFIFKVNRKINDGSGFININGNNGTYYQAYIKDPYISYNKSIINNYIKEYNSSILNVDYEKTSSIINLFGEVLNKIDTTISDYLIYLKKEYPLKAVVGNLKESSLIKRFSSGNRSIDFDFFKNDGIFYEIDCFYNKIKVHCIELNNEIKIPFNKYNFTIGKQMESSINVTTLLRGNIFYEVIRQPFIVYHDKPTTSMKDVLYKNKIATFECPDTGSEPIINKVWSIKMIDKGYAMEINNNIEKYGTKFYFENKKSHSMNYHSILYANSTDFQKFGHIQCTVVNKFGEGIISYRVIELEKMKSLISFTVSKIDIYNGDSVTFNCSASETHDNLNLQMYGPSINGSTRLLESFAFSKHEKIYIFERIELQDSGEYSCQGNVNSDFIMEEKLQINVHQSDVIFPDGKEFIKNVNIGSNVILECPIILQSFSFIQWSFIDETNINRIKKPINDVDGNLFIQGNRSLIIQQMTISNVGQYIFEIHFDGKKEECNFRVFTDFSDPVVKIKQSNNYIDYENKQILKQKEIIKVGEPIHITCFVEYESTISTNVSIIKKNHNQNMELNHVTKHAGDKAEKIIYYKSNASINDNGDYYCIVTTFFFNKRVIYAKTKIIVTNNEEDKMDTLSKECNIEFPEAQTHKTFFFLFFIIGILETILLMGIIYFCIFTTMLIYNKKRPKRF
ncbi:Immunoglobulin subtype domain and Immunoglobulin-like domain and Immunoglobulin-like fold domain-containing protein [Strongyloides ratti]|uniref:Immunoglobulin subtype domain and Immunoglobulin-like domain and Immunoglobulin-like fold domain-containing protein n=1 Tax=Strongyloides ratti TaxID=34506 RepID=A0A090LCF5_STRRB|nr:Immunoglobulin subtype domain and Immunoglobulin-like domain and Immunoglobulin-like fold domain-containing protein [Strongyloides ratti]CEF67452.1 Immunoglobulin subtype domain and Immunoglobulin-like domain and Immunoglobulin-like fold domain-containing protein [Strongyloides ratti]